MKRFFTGFTYGILLFASGVIFGFGINGTFVKKVIITAYDYGYSQGAESVILETLDNKTGKFEVAENEIH